MNISNSLSYKVFRQSWQTTFWKRLGLFCSEQCWRVLGHKKKASTLKEKKEDLLYAKTMSLIRKEHEERLCLKFQVNLIRNLSQCFHWLSSLAGEEGLAELLIKNPMLTPDLPDKCKSKWDLYLYKDGSCAIHWIEDDLSECISKVANENFLNKIYEISVENYRYESYSIQETAQAYYGSYANSTLEKVLYKKVFSLPKNSDFCLYFYDLKSLKYFLISFTGEATSRDFDNLCSLNIEGRLCFYVEEVIDFLKTQAPDHDQRAKEQKAKEDLLKSKKQTISAEEAYSQWEKIKASSQKIQISSEIENHKDIKKGTGVKRL